MKRALLIPLVFLSLLSSAATPPAGSRWKDVKITDITIYAAGGSSGKGYVVVTFASNGLGTPSCAGDYPKNLVIDLTNPGGTLATTAVELQNTLGSLVTVTGTCSIVPSMETLASIHLTSISDASGAAVAGSHRPGS